MTIRSHIHVGYTVSFLSSSQKLRKCIWRTCDERHVIVAAADERDRLVERHKRRRQNVVRRVGETRLTVRAVAPRVQLPTTWWRKTQHKREFLMFNLSYRFSSFG